MIDNPENGHNPDMRVKEADPPPDVQTATAVAEPDAQTSQPGETISVLASDSIYGTSPQTPMTESAPMAPTAGNQPAAVAKPVPAPTEPAGETDFSPKLTKFRQSFEEIQAEFIGEPRAAVEKAETLIDGLMNALHDQLQRIHSNVKSETDTEQLRVAMLSYRELLDSLGGHRAA
jgi:hypothetical protein